MCFFKTLDFKKGLEKLVEKKHFAGSYIQHELAYWEDSPGMLLPYTQEAQLHAYLFFHCLLSKHCFIQFHFFLRTVISHLSFLYLLALSCAATGFLGQQFSMGTGKKQWWVSLAACSSPSLCGWWGTGGGRWLWEIVLRARLRITDIKYFQYEGWAEHQLCSFWLLPRGKCVSEPQRSGAWCRKSGIWH